ncbi:MAG: restriction endonuclease subunit S, partial [Pseudomonadota bacterium]|nr:restriction endonuclease subunit S [Pseudomonadota bacterium]
MAARRSQQSLPRVVASGEPITDWRLGRLQFRPSHVPANWELAPIVTVARLESGHTPSRKRPEYWNGDIPWVSLHDTKYLDVRELYETQQMISHVGLNNSSARLLPRGTVVFSRTATVGKCTVIGREMATSQDFANYVCGPKLHNHYLVQLFRHLEPEWQRLMAGSTHSTVYMPVFEQLQVLLPPVEEQRKIADILHSIDDVIEKTEGVIEQLQVVKRSIMQELLTRGLPGRHTRFKKTEIGEIPEEWQQVTLGAAGRWLSGGTPSKQDPTLWSGDLPWVSPKDMKRSRISDAIDHIAHKALGRGTQLAPVGSILMVVRGMILAHTFPVAITMAPVAFNQDIKALVAGEGFEPEFLLYWLELRSSDVLRLVDVANHGTKRLPTELLFASLVPKPPLEEQRSVTAILRSADRRREIELKALQDLRFVKSALMSVLLTGELRVTPNQDA